MAQRKSHASDKAPSQRQLRVVLVVFAFSLWSGAAMAEVCDKVTGDDYWRPEGAIWAMSIATAVELAAIVAALVYAYTIKTGWLAWLMAPFILLRALYVAAWMVEDDIYSAAVREGCRSLRVDQVHIGFLVILAIACVWLGLRSRGRHAEAT